MKNDLFIIAEIGCNHNGSLELAKKMIYEAKKTGVDAVKFQVFNSEALISRYADKAEYQKITTGIEENQLEMTKKLELSHKEYLELKRISEEEGLTVFATPFDDESIDFLAEIKQTIWKIPSGEITNLPYLEKINSLDIENKKIILSTGMATNDEIKNALEILNDCKDIILLHCNTEYPTPDEDVNLLAISSMQETFSNYEIGFSDHSVGCTAALGAVALGVKVIEKHFTMDKDLEGPDHKASATPVELKELCEKTKQMKVLLGSKEKKVTASEAKNKKIARKSIVALRNIKKGEILTEENITCKRPGNGISPMHWYEIIGKVAPKDFKEDQLISVAGIEWEN